MLRLWLRSYVRVNVLRRGLTGNSRLWMAIGAGVALRRLYRRFGGKDEAPVFGEPLAPGERLVITYAGAPLPRRRLQQYRRSAVQALQSSEPR